MVFVCKHVTDNRPKRLSAELRKRAEELINIRGSDAKDARAGVLRLVRELEVYQGELQMQNEAHRRRRCTKSRGATAARCE